MAGDWRHRTGDAFEFFENGLVGAGENLSDGTARGFDSVAVREHAERDDARDLLRMGQVAGDVFADLSRTQRHDPDVRLTDLERARYVQKAFSDGRAHVEFVPIVERNLDVRPARVTARSDDVGRLQCHVGDEPPQRPIPRDLKRHALATFEACAQQSGPGQQPAERCARRQRQLVTRVGFAHENGGDARND